MWLNHPYGNNDGYKPVICFLFTSRRVFGHEASNNHMPPSFPVAHCLSVGPAQPHIRRTGIRRRYSPKGRRRRPSGPARGSGRWPGRKASAASCVSASSTPTADPDSEGLDTPQGRKVRAWRLLCKRSEQRSRRDRQSGSAPAPDGDDADTHGLASGGSGPQKTP